MNTKEKQYVEKLEEVVDYFFRHENSIRIENYRDTLSYLKSDMEKEPALSAEELLEKITGKSIQYLKMNFITLDQCLKAMEEYRNL